MRPPRAEDVAAMKGLVEQEKLGGTGHRRPTPLERWGARTLPLVLVGVMGLALGRPGWSAPKLYDPDKDTCQSEAIRNAYQANLLPWEDQPAVVQQRLRQLQAAMTLDTLRDCQARGLLSAGQAASLEAELNLRATSADPKALPEPSQSPTRP